MRLLEYLRWLARLSARVARHVMLYCYRTK